MDWVPAVGTTIRARPSMRMRCQVGNCGPTASDHRAWCQCVAHRRDYGGAALVRRRAYPRSSTRALVQMVESGWGLQGGEIIAREADTSVMEVTIASKPGCISPEFKHSWGRLHVGPISTARVVVSTASIRTRRPYASRTSSGRRSPVAAVDSALGSPKKKIVISFRNNARVSGSAGLSP